MATAAENVALLDRYFRNGAVFGPDAFSAGKAMKDLMFDATWDLFSRSSREAQRLFARNSMFERTLNPPSIMRYTQVGDDVKRNMIEPLYNSLTGGIWGSPDPSGITEWIGSEAGGREYFIAALNDPPRVYNPREHGYDEDPVELEMDPTVLQCALKIIRDVGLPVSWYAPLLEKQVFKKLESRISTGWYSVSGETSQAVRRALLVLNAQAQARVQAVLAEIATKEIGSFPSFPAGDGAGTPTVPPAPKRWQRNGWLWLGAGLAFVGGGAAAAAVASRR